MSDNLATCPWCLGEPIFKNGRECLHCFGAGRVSFNGLCLLCKAKSLDPLCPSCQDLEDRRFQQLIDAISFLPPSVVK